MSDAEIFMQQQPLGRCIAMHLSLTQESCLRIRTRTENRPPACKGCAGPSFGEDTVQVLPEKTVKNVTVYQLAAKAGLSYSITSKIVRHLRRGLPVRGHSAIRVKATLEELRLTIKDVLYLRKGSPISKATRAIRMGNMAGDGGCYAL